MARKVLMVNPKTRTTRKKNALRKPAAKRKANPARTGKAAASEAGRKLRYRRKNPIKKGIINEKIVPAAIAGTGAVGLNILFDNLPVPDQYKQGNMRYLAEALVILGFDWAAKETKIIKNARMRNDITGGALTVLAYKVISQNVTPMIGGMATRVETVVQNAEGVQGYQMIRNMPTSQPGMAGYQYPGTGMGFMNSAPVAPVPNVVPMPRGRASN